ncbi:MAG: hypothetical protein PHW53_04135 [Patescibacteria group bacterium]|nr:hypothetical protein [Patescibacteria group bacterium]
MRKKIFLVSFAIFCLSVMPVFAATVGSGETYWQGPEKTVSGNLYLSFGNIDISGKVDGDLVAVGGNILITGEVTGDILVAGGSIDIWGKVGGDVRAAGGKVFIANDVAGDVLAAGGMVQVRPNVKVGGDVIMAGTAVFATGNIAGNVRVAGETVLVAGNIGGNVRTYSEEGPTISEPTRIAGNLEYSSFEAIEIPAGVEIVGETVFNKTSPQGPAVPRQIEREVQKPILILILGIFLVYIIKVIFMIFAALFGVIAYPKKSKEFVDNTLGHFGRSFLIGLLFAVAAPVAIFLLMVSVLGTMLGMAAALLYGLFMMIACVYAGVILGALIFRIFKRSKAHEVNWVSALVGVVVLNAIRLIPIIGWIFCGVFVLAALGALAEMVYKQYWVNR